MNENDAENKQLEALLRKAHLHEPSPQLHERITAAAKKAWNQVPPELPWLIPFRHLAASAAAAILIIWLTNYASDCSLGQWSSGLVRASSQRTAEIEVLPEMPYGPFVSRLAVLNRRPSMIDASALKDHVEALRYILDEAQQISITKPPVPAEGRSHLFTNPPSAGSYS